MPTQLPLSSKRPPEKSLPFAERVLTWFKQHGRKNLPWQKDISAYRVWVSEIMLQQTQVNTVIPYYEKFMESFPDVVSLANADQDYVLKHWSGLGYYARARNLHKAAQTIKDVYSGEFPQKFEQVIALSGIGRSTAGAILSIAYQQPHAILDGNVKRVLSRYYAIEGWPGKAAVQKQLWAYAELSVPNAPPESAASYTQAMMDLGATVCIRSKPKCVICPLNRDCKALQLAKPQDYPHSKPKKTLAERSCIMLVIQNQQDDVFLQKRPPTGVWGGLWCLPEFQNNNSAALWLADQFDIALSIDEHLPQLKHTFSHFRLTIQPYLLQIESTNQRVMEANSQLWYNTNTEFDGGLAAPITTLLKSIKKRKTHDENG